MFTVGDKVCYPMHGIGVIHSIEERTVLGKTQSYYVLRFITGRMTAMVPVDTAIAVGLRGLISLEECTQVLDYLSQPPEEENENWNQRYRDNFVKLRGGSVFDVADVVKCLNKRDSEKGLSSSERKMLLTARQVLSSELAAVMGCAQDDFSAVIGE